MTYVALIPARGGSKRLPRKNIIDFLGKPIIVHTIEAALQAGCFSRVVVSTDDLEIAQIAKLNGAEVSMRDSLLSSDNATVLDVCNDFLNMNQDVDVLVVLYATSPLRNSMDIKEVINLLDTECHFSMAVCCPEIPVHQVMYYNESSLKPVFSELINFRAELAPAFAIDNGSTYAFHVKNFNQEQTFYGSTLKGYLMPRDRSVDIDTYFDYQCALAYAQAED